MTTKSFDANRRRKVYPLIRKSPVIKFESDSEGGGGSDESIWDPVSLSLATNDSGFKIAGDAVIALQQFKSGDYMLYNKRVYKNVTTVNGHGSTELNLWLPENVANRSILYAAKFDGNEANDGALNAKGWGTPTPNIGATRTYPGSHVLVASTSGARASLRVGESPTPAVGTGGVYFRIEAQRTSAGSDNRMFEIGFGDGSKGFRVFNNNQITGTNRTHFGTANAPPNPIGNLSANYGDHGNMPIVGAANFDVFEVYSSGRNLPITGGMPSLGETTYVAVNGNIQGTFRRDFQSEAFQYIFTGVWNFQGTNGIQVALRNGVYVVF